MFCYFVIEFMMMLGGILGLLLGYLITDKKILEYYEIYVCFFEYSFNGEVNYFFYFFFFLMIIFVMVCFICVWLMMWYMMYVFEILIK